MTLPNHLGGHNNKTHLDHGAIKWLMNEFQPKSFLDIGCGPGGMVELASKLGLNSLGIDGDFEIPRSHKNKFILHDYTKGKVKLNQNFDIGWSVEFVEHVDEQYAHNYIDTMQHCKYLIITYAPPGWPGHHHVNCQPEEYWIDILAMHGLVYNKKRTTELRDKSTMNFPKKPKKAFVKNRGLFFENVKK